ncbi:MAG: flagellar protein FlbD [Geobacter sp.]|nr:flagellar protein FlbD [Geobacter sp.]
MIRLTRLDGSEMYLNPAMIEVVEESPDTHITLSNGNRYLVLEPARVIIERIVLHQARILHRAAPSLYKKYLQRRNAEKFRPYCKLERQ